MRALALLLGLFLVLFAATAGLELGLLLHGRAIAQLDWQRGLLEQDRERGWVGIPGASRWVENGTHDVFVAHGEDGRRDPEPAYRDDASHHILVLGGSTAWGQGVGRGNLVSDWLRRGLPDRIAVHNDAMHGYEAGRMLETLRLALDRQPYDEVLLVLSPSDPVLDDVAELPVPGSRTLPTRLEELTHTGRFLGRQLDRWQRVPSRTRAMPARVEDGSALRAIAALARDRGARLVFVHASTAAAVSGEARDSETGPYRELERIASEAGASFLDLTPTLRAALPKSGLESLFDPVLGLWTHRSHFLAAQALIDSRLLLASRSAFERERGVRVAPEHPSIQYRGRVDRSRMGVVRGDWPGVALRIHLEASACRFFLQSESGSQDWNVLIDGSRRFVFRAGPGRLPLELRGLGPGPHRIELQKRAQSGPFAFRGLEIPTGGRLLEPPPPSARRIEILGASLAGGMGTEGLHYGHRNRGAESRVCPDERRLADVHSSFGAFLGARYDAEVRFLTHDAAGVIRSYRDPAARSETPYPSYFPRTLASLPSEWRGAWQPDLVIMNLGENDYANDVPLDEEAFVSEYVRFLGELRARYPDAYLIAFDDEEEVQLLERVGEVIAVRHAAGDPRIELVSYPAARRREKGCKSHPTADKHRALARILEPRVEHALGWTAAR